MYCYGTVPLQDRGLRGRHGKNSQKKKVTVIFLGKKKKRGISIETAD